MVVVSKFNKRNKIRAFSPVRMKMRSQGNWRIILESVEQAAPGTNAAKAFITVFQGQTLCVKSRPVKAKSNVSAIHKRLNYGSLSPTEWAVFSAFAESPARWGDGLRIPLYPLPSSRRRPRK
jgi:hypothetical protein